MNRDRGDLYSRLAARNAESARASVLRRVRNVEKIDGAHVWIDNRQLLNFASNDYLGLARHPRVTEALLQAARIDGVGAGAAHLLGGHRDAHSALEESLARWTGRERALLFSSGYLANLGVIAGLLEADDLCVQDKLNHASLVDAARLAGCIRRRYVHGDTESAARQLALHPHVLTLLASDGVFSMDGDIAPLTALATVCRDERATLMVDDAHGIGVLGADGAGSVVAAGLSQHDVPILMATLGKAIGTFGAFVAGSAELIDALIQNARTFIYTTATPPALAAATLAAIEIARFEDWRRQRLTQLVAHFRHGAIERGIELLPSTTPIQPVLIGASETALAIAKQLEIAGLHVPAIRPPTVAKGTARLRVTFSALHSESDVERLLIALEIALANARQADP